MLSGSLHPSSVTKMHFKLTNRLVELKKNNEATALLISASEDRNSLFWGGGRGEVVLVNPLGTVGDSTRVAAVTRENRWM